VELIVPSRLRGTSYRLACDRYPCLAYRTPACEAYCGERRGLEVLDPNDAELPAVGQGQEACAERLGETVGGQQETWQLLERQGEADGFARCKPESRAAAWRVVRVEHRTWRLRLDRPFRALQIRKAGKMAVMKAGDKSQDRLPGVVVAGGRRQLGLGTPREPRDVDAARRRAHPGKVDIGSFELGAELREVFLPAAAIEASGRGRRSRGQQGRNTRYDRYAGTINHAPLHNRGRRFRSGRSRPYCTFQRFLDQQARR
jgi:hypothetical protein